jgi:phosphoribosylanthranilate isomerase
MSTQIKICGITNLEDAICAVDAGADQLGFNFYPGSSRYIDPTHVSSIIRQLPSKKIIVGVFVNPQIQDLESVVEILDQVQLHGDESPDFVQMVREDLGSYVTKALRVSEDFDPAVASEYGADVILLDTPSEHFGGSGVAFDWSIALKFKTVVPKFYLAGGLDPDNVADAIRAVRPYAVDVCSGVESAKGKKDHAKLSAFIRNARAAI